MSTAPWGQEKRINTVRYVRLNPYTTFPAKFEYTFELVNASTKEVVHNGLEALGTCDARAPCGRPATQTQGLKYELPKKDDRDADKATYGEPAPASAEFRLRKGTLELAIQQCQIPNQGLHAGRNG